MGKTNLVVRKDVSRLTEMEVFDLRHFFENFKEDSSVDGFEATAEYHGLPARCPRPDARVRYACCIHGMPTFLHWHRLFVVQVEDSLRKRGFRNGIPYWDWTKPMTALPALAADATYVHPYTHENVSNPLHHGYVRSLGTTTTRNPDHRLFEQPAFGDHTTLYDGVLLALEQDDFCDFEIQFEVVHNAVHAWVGGGGKVSLASLHYSAFDPLFVLHHSNVDRIWAIWQALQIYRGKPYKAHCAKSYTQESLKPFAFEDTYNPNERTRKHSVPADSNIYEYQAEFGYRFDSLQFGGMSIPELHHYLVQQAAKDRIFAGFLLSGIKTSANVEYVITRAGHDDFSVGSFAVLGGIKEMSWRFDRLYKADITAALNELGLSKDDDFEVHVNIVEVNGTKLSDHLIPHPTVFFQPGSSKCCI